MSGDKQLSNYKSEIFTIKNDLNFENLALQAFKIQSEQNAVYRDFIQYLGLDRGEVDSYLKIPFMPAGFFKTHKIITGNSEPVLKFSSSGTTGEHTSTHFIVDPDLYKTSFTRCFSLLIGDPAKYCFLALLPSYLQRAESSLVYMVDHLIKLSVYPESGFYIYDFDKLADKIKTNEQKKIPTILLGVTYALLDFADHFPINLENTLVMETGGMKGRRKEMTREEVHLILKNKFGIARVLSEYGMTELLSQAYMLSESGFSCPPWMRVRMRETTDPLAFVDPGKTGGICITDLANIHSCCFIATDDLGKITGKNSFAVIGRYDSSDIRGCNLLADYGM